MMDEDEAQGRQRLVAAPPLDRLGVEELHAYVAALRQEIGRAETEIAKKATLKSAADGFFRTPG